MTTFQITLNSWMMEDKPQPYYDFIDRIYENEIDYYTVEQMEDKYFVNSVMENVWLYKLFLNGYSPKQAGKILVRGFGIYNK